MQGEDWNNNSYLKLNPFLALSYFIAFCSIFGGLILHWTHTPDKGKCWEIWDQLQTQTLQLESILLFWKIQMIKTQMHLRSWSANICFLHNFINASMWSHCVMQFVVLQKIRTYYFPLLSAGKWDIGSVHVAKCIEIPKLIWMRQIKFQKLHLN